MQNERIHPAVRVGHVHLRVADLERALAFYRDGLGFGVIADGREVGLDAAFLAAGDYHHHIGLNTWESAGGTPPPPGHTGLYHVAFNYPDRRELAARSGACSTTARHRPRHRSRRHGLRLPRRSRRHRRRALLRPPAQRRGSTPTAGRCSRPTGSTPQRSSETPPIGAQPMYAQVIQGGTTPDSRDAMDHIVTDEMIPALEAEPGFAGALNLVDPETGNAMMVVLWETETQARRALPEYGSAFLKALADVAAISTGNRQPISVWEVNARAHTPLAPRRALAVPRWRSPAPPPPTAAPPRPSGSSRPTRPPAHVRRHRQARPLGRRHRHRPRRRPARNGTPGRHIQPGLHGREPCEQSVHEQVRVQRSITLKDGTITWTARSSPPSPRAPRRSPAAPASTGPPTARSSSAPRPTRSW